jgi:hypothetical protein
MMARKRKLPGGFRPVALMDAHPSKNGLQGGKTSWATPIANAPHIAVNGIKPARSGNNLGSTVLPYAQISLKIAKISLKTII